MGTWVTYNEVNEDAWLNEIVDALKPYTWTMATATHAKSPSHLAFNQAGGAMHILALFFAYSRTPSFATIFPPLTT